MNRAVSSMLAKEPSLSPRKAGATAASMSPPALLPRFLPRLLAPCRLVRAPAASAAQLPTRLLPAVLAPAGSPAVTRVEPAAVATPAAVRVEAGPVVQPAMAMGT